ncbi:MAG: glycosyltransferase [Candidatus Aenigmarchaeota archaeon]|nr:glycosyltransferase [Candidatus Aenigmarchaeota archaeon]
MISKKNILGTLAGNFSHQSHREMFNLVCDKVINLNNPPHQRSILNFIRRGFHIFKNINRKEFSQYEFILTESPLLEPNFNKKFFNSSFKIITLFSSPGIYKVFDAHYGFVFSSFLKTVIKESDAFLAVSKMCLDYLKEYDIYAPSLVTYPYVSPDKYEILKNNTYHPDSNYILAIGYPIEYKGIDFTLKIFDILSEEKKDLRLKIITKTLSPKYLGGVKNTDKIDIYSGLDTNNFCRLVGGAKACVHMGRFDTFPISTLETMLAGVPTFVSDKTGTKEVVGEVDKRYILPFDIHESIENIEWFFSLKEKQKTHHSGLFRRHAQPFNRPMCLRDFKQKFERIIECL